MPDSLAAFVPTTCWDATVGTFQLFFIEAGEGDTTSTAGYVEDRIGISVLAIDAALAIEICHRRFQRAVSGGSEWRDAFIKGLDPIAIELIEDSTSQPKITTERSLLPQREYLLSTDASVF